MQNKEGRHFTKKQGAVLVFSLFLTGAAAFGTVYTLNYAERQQEEQEQTTELEEELRIQESNLAKNVTPKDDTAEDEADMTEGVAVSNGDAKEELKEDPEELLSSQKESEVSGEVSSSNVEASLGHILEEEPVVNNVVFQFSEDSILDWPVAGNVLIDYSMNATVYFPTLNVYKYNPALIIGADVGSQVVASAAGVVESVAEDSETGTTLTVNMGNNYKLVYGQLQNVAVSIGDNVETGTLLGYVAEPTKYYCEEGSNLYFKMTKDGAPVDPFLYLGE